MSIRTTTVRELQRGVDHIGVTCVFFCHDGRGNFVLHKRSAACRDEQGRWDNGGGALEFGENFEDAIRREVQEEYCAEALDIQFLSASNVLREHGGAPTHWVALLFAVRVDRAQVRIGEPEKMDDLGWFTADALPNPLHSQMLRHFEYVKRAGLTAISQPQSSKNLEISPGVYRHYKGGRYQVLGVAEHSETGEALVTYQALDGGEEGKLWVRPLTEFSEEVLVDGTRQPRFTYIE